ncbi:MAG: restriction endonuclease subunit S, partial [bacterium]|nr:restriction endonuclease subunit S [bacterium]
TEYAIYRSLAYDGELVPMWGGNQEHETINQYVSVNAKNKDNEPIRIFEGPCLIISLDGSAGSMTYKKKGEKFALNHHAGVLKCKDALKLNLEYFKYKFENYLKSLAVSDGSKTLSIGLLEKQLFELPEIKEQEKLVERYRKLAELKNKLKGYLSTIQDLESKEIN